MNQLNKANLKLLREEINEALSQVAQKHDIKIHAGNASFSDFNATFKLEIALKQDGAVITKEAQAFLDYAELLGLSQDMLNQEFECYGQRYILTGYKPRSTKFPFIAKKVSDGKSYKLPEYAVKKEFFKIYA